MRSLLVLFILNLSIFTLSAQQFNTARILNPREISGAITPVVYNKGFDQIGIFLNGGFGLSHTTDIAVRYGVLEGQDYIGADIEWAIKKSEKISFSLMSGMHKKDFFGLDAGLAASFPLGSNIYIFSGVDVDVNFEREIQHYIWIPIGIEAYWRKNFSVIFEIDLPMSEWAGDMFGGGIILYL